jgi:hypothetical protein
MVMENGGRKALAEAEEGEKSNPRRSNRTARSNGKLNEGEIWQQIQKAVNREQEIRRDSCTRMKTMTSKANLVGSNTAENTMSNDAGDENNFVLDEENPQKAEQFSESLKRQMIDAIPSERASKLLKTAPQSAVPKSATQQTIITPTIPYRSKTKAGIEAYHKGKARTDKAFEMQRHRLAQERPPGHSNHDTPHLSSQDNVSQTVKPVRGTKMKQQWWDGINTPEGEREHLRKLREEAKCDRLRRKTQPKN